MDFQAFLTKCRSEPTVSDFESYLSYCILEKKHAESRGEHQCSVEMYCYLRDQAFERRDEKAARRLYEMSEAATWKENEWEGALR
ncbi:MAG: hypothetical protein ACLFVT_06260 [Syntrophobacteria bacterium]